MSDVGRERSGYVGTERNNSGNDPTEVLAYEQTQRNFGSPRGVDDNGTEHLLNEPAGVTEDHQASIAGETYVIVIQPDLSRMSSSGRASLERIGSNAERQVSIGNHLSATMDNMTTVGRVDPGNFETELNLWVNAPPEVLAEEQTHLNFGSPRGVNEPAGVTEGHHVSTAGEFYERLIPPDLDSWSIQDLQRLVSHANRLLSARINMSDVGGEGSGFFGNGTSYVDRYSYRNACRRSDSRGLWQSSRCERARCRDGGSSGFHFWRKLWTCPPARFVESVPFRPSIYRSCWV